jgi:hypothetical protein
MAAMSSLHAVRLVVQFVRDATKPLYRVVVYPGPRDVPLSVDVLSRDELLERLRATIPDFDEKHILGTSEATQIVFAEHMELSDTQLSSLGLVSYC